ncbi:hypothetical protein [Sphingobacterium sp.]|uniref:hypothetical protein n=1 Tax=Sphingobacterium sp. TaxID=341027 RepID=UPI0028A25896|nr:hypothetical protein [Sphingobacterium sp.]
MISNKTLFASLAALTLLASCNNQTPQEKAAENMEHAEDKAADANEEAMKTSEDAATKDAEAMVYSDKAAANAAIASVAAPVLSNDKAKELYTKLGKTWVERINAETADKALDKEKSLLDIKNEIEKSVADGKISASDKDNIMKYQSDCIAAVKAAL